MKDFPTLLIRIALLAMLSAEFILARFQVTRLLAPFVGIMMALVVVFTIMQLGNSRGLIPIFALAGVFWLCVMLGMGSLDRLTRHDVYVSPAPLPPRY